MKIRGNSVGTTISPEKIAKEIRPVLYTKQALTDEQKAIARNNIGCKNLLYSQSEEPTEAIDGDVWIDTEEEPEEGDTDSVSTEEMQNYVDNAIKSAFSKITYAEGVSY